MENTELNLNPNVSSLNSALTDGLNKEQKAAVTSTGGDVLVLAGAGSGKTKVLSTRIAWLIEQGKATDESILAVTFTNKAAKEMKSRISKLTGRKSANLLVGTFHGICNQMLREFSKELGIVQNFHIIDPDDQKSICKRLIKELNLEDRDAKDVVNYINGIKEDSIEPGGDAVLDDLFRRYSNICEREGAMDFADLMSKVNIALTHNVAGMRDHYNKRFTHILIDEFQDTNSQQYKWLSMLRTPETEVFAVGDDDQSIYSFRGANPLNMTKFTSRIKPENIIRLEQNYRSTHHILNSANHIISVNPDRMGKTLRTETMTGDMVDVCEFNNNKGESDFIAQKAKMMIMKGEKPEEIAVLYRSNHQSISIEKSLLKYNVPYIIYGGTRFFERREIKDAAAYLRLALNRYDDSAFLRVVNFPSRGIGDKVIDFMESVVTGSETETCYMDVAETMAVQNKKLGLFTSIVNDLDEKFNDLGLPEAIEYMLDRSGLLEHYSKSQDDESRKEHLRELVALSKRYVTEEAKPGLNTKEQLMEFLSTFTLEDTKEQEVSAHSKKAVILMTIHASKGLEFDNVFLTGAEDGTLPHENSLSGDRGGSIEEERRLMYVAVTRARKKLYITNAKERYVFNKVVKLERSMFLDDLPESSVRNMKEKSSELVAKNGYEQKAGQAKSGNPFFKKKPAESLDLKLKPKRIRF